MSLVKDLAIGSAAGYAGLKALTYTSNAVYTMTPETIIRQEHEIERRDPFRILASRIADTVGMEINEAEKDRMVRAIDLTVGTGMGIAYVMAARRWPLGWLAGGAAFGTLYFLVMDEGVSPALGLVGDNRLYPWQSHARGLAAHAAFGLAAGVVGALLGVHGNKRKKARRQA